MREGAPPAGHGARHSPATRRQAGSRPVHGVPPAGGAQALLVGRASPVEVGRCANISAQIGRDGRAFPFHFISVSIFVFMYTV
jgi:hypothetical protein